MLKMSKLSRAGLFLLVLTGCAPSMKDLKVRDPDLNIPASYDAPEPSAAQAPTKPVAAQGPGNPGVAQEPTKPEAVDGGKTETKDTRPMVWQDFFQDKRLADLIDSALRKIRSWRFSSRRSTSRRTRS